MLASMLGAATVVAFQLGLPEWVPGFLLSWAAPVADVRDRMALAVALASENHRRRTGGPFGALVFDLEEGELVAVGVNVVEATGCSLAHAETMALALAQQARGSFDLGGPGLASHELVTSSEPCSMCFGAVLWSGVRSLVCGARDEDARAIGFDEGPKPPGWIEALESRGIRVRTDVLRAEARSVLEHYRNEGGAIYNARRA